MIIKRFNWICLAVIFLTGCTIKSKVPLTPSQKQQVALSELSQWTLNGRMAFKSDLERVSAYMNWQQNEQQYLLKLNTFVGTSIFTIQGSEQSATLRKGEESYFHPNPDEIIRDITGWDIPLLQLQYWVKGHVRDAEVIAQFDEQGFLSSLVHKKTQWQVEYDDYQNVGTITLPHTIEVSKDDKLIKIRVKKWQLGNNE
jgi:outer membrane lipoprotein LolB